MDQRPLYACASKRDLVFANTNRATLENRTVLPGLSTSPIIIEKPVSASTQGQPGARGSYMQPAQCEFTEQAKNWTVGVGGNISGAYLIRAGVTAQLVYDGENVGLLIAGAGGAGTPVVGASAVLTVTNAADIFQLRGMGIETGVPASGMPIPLVPEIGIEGVIADGFQGVNLSTNWEVKPMFEGHGELSYTLVIELHGDDAEKAKQYIHENIEAFVELLSLETRKGLADYLGLPDLEFE